MKNNLRYWLPTVTSLIILVIAFFLTREFDDKDSFEDRLLELEISVAVEEDRWVRLESTLTEIKQDIRAIRDEREN